MNTPSPELIAALIAAKGQFTDVLFDSENPHFKSKFASLAAMHAATTPALLDHGLVIVQAPCYVEGQLAVVTTIAHDSGAIWESTLPMPPTKNDPQGYGSAITYARRYAYAAVLGLTGVMEDDADIASQDTKIPDMAKTAITALTEGDWVTLIDLAKDEDYQKAWKLLGSKDRSAIKSLESRRSEYRDRLQAAALKDDYNGVVELTSEMTTREKTAVWEVLDADTRAHIQEMKDAA